MDDGLQNPSLAKDLTIAVIDGARGIGNGLAIPAGPLRAPLDFQLEITDAILVNGGEADAPVAEWLRHRFVGSVLRASVTPAEDSGWLKGQRVVAWAGIAAPQRFFAMLRSLGAEVVETVPFRDHQWLERGRRPPPARSGRAASCHAGHDRQGHGPPLRRCRPAGSARRGLRACSRSPSRSPSPTPTA